MQEGALVHALHRHVSDAHRVAAYYGPLAAGCAVRLERAARRPWVLGLQGPQGCGKTTLATALVAAWRDVGVRAMTVSVDDFYLTHDEQRALADRHPGNPYLQYRGYPGTHDVGLGARTIDALAALGPGEELRVPRYLKSAHAGRGDRADSSAWARVVGPVDVILFEGWMLGFRPVDAGAVEADLRAPNAMLAAYGEWNRRLDAFVELEAESLEVIVDWRVDAERRRRQAGEEALSDEDARDYIERFLPAYRAYLPGLRSRPPCTDTRVVVLGRDRMPHAAVPT